MSAITDYIKKKVENGDLKSALENTLEYFKQQDNVEMVNELTVLTGQLKTSNREFLSGMRTREINESEIARINFALLNIIDSKVEFYKESNDQYDSTNHIKKFVTLTSNLKVNGTNLIEYVPKTYTQSIDNHIKHTKLWADSIVFRDLMKEKSTLQTYIDLDYFVVPKSLHVEEEEAIKINLLSIFNYTQKHILLLGQPGSGKTTTMKRLVHFTTDQPLREELEKFQYPLVIRLREWNDFEHKSLFIEILNIYNLEVKDPTTFHHAIRNSPTLVFLCHFIDRLQILLIIDGLDELRNDLKRKLLLEIKMLSDRLSHSRIIITSRPGENPQIGSKFKEFEICPLDNKQIEQFIYKWLGQSPKSKKLKEQILNSPFSDTITRPLTLSHLCALHERNNRIPSKPKLIYKKIINLLIEEWDDQRGVDRVSKYSDFESDRKHDFLSYLAFIITTKIKKVVFSKRELSDAYKAICLNFGLPIDEVKIVVKELESHTGIFIQSGYEKYEFAHKSIQEYLTADYIVKLPLFPKHETLMTIPTELALATAISPNPTQYFSSLIYSRLLNKKLSINFLDVFFNRLKLEKTDFRVDYFLGISFLSLFSWLMFNSVKSSKDTAKFNKVINLFHNFENAFPILHQSIEMVLEYYVRIPAEEELDKLYLSETCNALSMNRYEASLMCNFRRFDRISLIKQIKPRDLDNEFSSPKYLIIIEKEILNQ